MAGEDEPASASASPRFRFTQEHDPDLHEAVDRIEPFRLFQIIKLSLSADPHRSSTSMEYF